MRAIHYIFVALLLCTACRASRSERTEGGLTVRSVEKETTGMYAEAIEQTSRETEKDSVVERFAEWVMTDSAGRMLLQLRGHDRERHRVSGKACSRVQSDVQETQAHDSDSVLNGGWLDEVTVKAPRRRRVWAWLCAVIGMAMAAGLFVARRARR